MISELELFTNIFLACISAYLVISINYLIKNRRWFSLIILGLMILILPIISLILNYFNIDLTINLRTFFMMSGTVMVLVSASLYYANIPSRKIKKFIQNIKTSTNLNSGKNITYKWNYFKNKNCSNSIDIKGFVPLAITDYDINQLTEIGNIDYLKRQFTIYHIVDIKSFISWIDVMYWVALELLSNYGFKVKIYLDTKSNKKNDNTVFVNYVKKFVGRNVEIDTEIFNRFSLSDKNILKSKSVTYANLGAFAKLAPIMFHCKHSLILTWEGYLKDIRSIYDELSNIIEINTSSNNKLVNISLDGFRTGFIVFPSLCNLNGTISHIDSLKLGFESKDKLLEYITELSTPSIKLISSWIFKRGLYFYEKPMFQLTVTILLLLRKSYPSKKVHSIDRMIALVFFKVSFVIHKRIVQIDE